jgi:hypothetical protein
LGHSLGDFWGAFWAIFGSFLSTTTKQRQKILVIVWANVWVIFDHDDNTEKKVWVILYRDDNTEIFLRILFLNAYDLIIRD